MSNPILIPIAEEGRACMRHAANFKTPEKGQYRPRDA